MRISLKKIVHDIRGLIDEFPETYTYSIVLEASGAVVERAVAADQSLAGAAGKYTEGTIELLERLQTDSTESLKKGFFLHIQKPWNMINSAASRMPKESASIFLRQATSLFWDRIQEEDEAAKAHIEGRRYGAFWIPFLIGAAAIGSIGVYASGKSTGDYVDKTKEDTTKWTYLGAGAIAALGLVVLMRR